jgi:hypothetical protein
LVDEEYELYCEENFTSTTRLALNEPAAQYGRRQPLVEGQANKLLDNSSRLGATRSPAPPARASRSPASAVHSANNAQMSRSGSARMAAALCFRKPGAPKDAESEC